MHREHLKIKTATSTHITLDKINIKYPKSVYNKMVFFYRSLTVMKHLICEVSKYCACIFSTKT